MTIPTSPMAAIKLLREALHWHHHIHNGTAPGTLGAALEATYRNSELFEITEAALAVEIEQPNSEAEDKRRCKKCAARCGTETFEPDPRCGEEPRLPPIDRIRELAKEVGYAIGVHGSQQRDFDVIAAPWTENAVGNHDLLKHIAAGLTTDNGPAHIISTERKPLGRYAATIQMDGWYKQLDISVCPCTAPPALPPPAPDQKPSTLALQTAQAEIATWPDSVRASVGIVGAPDLDTVVKFLMGEAALNGLWFGDADTDHSPRQQFWWRKYLRAALKQSGKSEK